MAYAASRMQALTIAFPPRGRGGRRLLRFGLLAGAVSGFFPLLFALPGLADWYYVGLQKCRPEMLNLVRWSALGLLLHPLTMSLRAYAEGKAAVERKPVAVLTGQGAFLAVLALLSFTCLALNLSGNLIAPISLLGSNLAAAGVIHASLTWDRRQVVPVQIEREFE
jgi:O-antigen/teichoic acid export membrane protein